MNYSLPLGIVKTSKGGLAARKGTVRLLSDRRDKPQLRYLNTVTQLTQPNHLHKVQ
ncbi:hypothetical protein [Almyronema epifaneia]|uniref:Uncharacterized protein n=1 Tax=Almyronema epifaneia S1 TaxID=2991925 RepID=A0ABW6IIE5_9CYAN